MIYIVEDDVNIRQMESYALKNSGFETEEFGDATGFFERCEQLIPRLVILDVMLPRDDGLLILKEIRGNPRLRALPVIMVTAKASELDAVKGLDFGADDYITKPFGIMEFISRVKAVLRRTAPQTAVPCMSLGGIELDDGKHTVSANGVPCDLTYKEFELLKLLLLNEDIVLTREKIMDRVWGSDYEGETRTVDVHVKTLRQKLGECGNMIKTVRSVGYKIEVDNIGRTN
ncbi:MAG: response regulator transcription factor [Oscillospiraceae bacterium]